MGEHDTITGAGGTGTRDSGDGNDGADDGTASRAGDGLARNEKRQAPNLTASGEIPVNTETANDQHTPAITTLDDGGWVVT